MDVLEQEQHRFVSGEFFKLIQQRCKRLATLLSRAQDERWIAPLKRDREQRGKDGGDSLDPRGTHCEHGFKLVELLLWRIVSFDLSHTFDVRDERVECTVRAKWRTLVAQARVWLAGKALTDRCCNMRTANAQRVLSASSGLFGRPGNRALPAGRSFGRP